MPKRIPVKALGEFTETQDGEIAVLILRDKEGRTHVVTWGDNAQNCDYAAQFGEHVKKELGWPEHMWSTIPSRLAKYQKLLSDFFTDAREYLPSTLTEKWKKYHKGK